MRGLVRRLRVERSSERVVRMQRSPSAARIRLGCEVAVAVVVQIVASVLRFEEARAGLLITECLPTHPRHSRIGEKEANGPRRTFVRPVLGIPSYG